MHEERLILIRNKTLLILLFSIQKEILFDSFWQMFLLHIFKNNRRPQFVTQELATDRTYQKNNLYFVELDLFIL